MLVTSNHEFTIAAIDREEDEELARIDQEFQVEGHATL
jgi:hypothetical protein